VRFQSRFTEPADRPNDEERDDAAVRVGRPGRAPRHRSSMSFGGVTRTIMNEFQEIACRHFDFLTSRYGFQRTMTSPEHVRFESDKVFFDITSDVRDGISVDFGRFNQPGAVPEQHHERLSLDTFLAAIRTHEGTFRKSASASDSIHRTLGELAGGLIELGHGLIVADEQLYQRVRELRFWHVGEWTTCWGTTIVLSPQEIRRHQQLVPDILRLVHGHAEPSDPPNDGPATSVKNSDGSGGGRHR
jgi:hypothetical protein